MNQVYDATFTIKLQIHFAAIRVQFNSKPWLAEDIVALTRPDNNDHVPGMFLIVQAFCQGYAQN